MHDVTWRNLQSSGIDFVEMEVRFLLKEIRRGDETAAAKRARRMMSSLRRLEPSALAARADQMRANFATRKP